MGRNTFEITKTKNDMKKLLIIEDNQMMMTFLVEYFGSTYQTELATTPSEALEMINSNESDYDMILSDYKSKNDEEYVSLKKVAAQMKWQNIPMVILTDEDKSDQRLDSLSIGARDTLSKPFNPKELSMRLACLAGKDANNMEIYRKAA